jgi:sialate O-acetylesterase
MQPALQNNHPSTEKYRLMAVAVVMCWMMGLSPPLRGELMPSSIFGNNMVLQRDVPIPVHGTAGPAERVTVTLAAATAEATADERGRWHLELPAMPAGGPYVLQIRGSDTITFTNVMIGDVWLCVGQARMATYLNTGAQGREIVQGPGTAGLHLLVPPGDMAGKPRDNLRPLGWRVCTSDGAPARAAFTGIGYGFGMELRQSQEAAIGLIQVTVPNSRLPSWTPRQVMEADAALQHIVREADQTLAAYVAAGREYLNRLDEWEAAHGNDPEAVPPIPGLPPDPRRSPHRPSIVYNAMIAPLTRVPVRGVVCLFGDLDAPFAADAARLLPAMLAGWRDAWGQPQMPIILAISPGAGSAAAANGDSTWAELREAQQLAGRDAQITAVVTLDLADDVEIGRRLGRAARGAVYGEAAAWQGPLFESAESIGGRMRIRFRKEAGRLSVAEGEKLRGFAVAGEDRKFVPADAVIEEGAVVVSSPQVSAPVAVRYNWGDAPDGNLVDEHGLPVAPFRSDDWPGVTESNRYQFRM